VTGISIPWAFEKKGIQRRKRSVKLGFMIFKLRDEKTQTVATTY